MHFQRKEFVDKTREKTVRKYIVLIVVLTMCPAVYLTFGIIKSTFYEAAANRFISDQLSLKIHRYSIKRSVMNIKKCGLF